MLVRGARECRSGVVPPGVSAVQLFVRIDYAQYPNRTGNAKTARFRRKSAAGSARQCRKISDADRQTFRFSSREQFMPVCARFFWRFVHLRQGAFCATIIPDRFPATDGQGGAQTTGEQEVPYQRQVRLYLFSCRPSGQCRDYFNAMLSFFVALFGAE